MRECGFREKEVLDSVKGYTQEFWERRVGEEQVDGEEHK